MEFMYVAAWQYNKDGKPKLFKENLEYKNVKLKTRSYK
jgi:succinate dehydrogenase / fumarate reductase flavoprotein subunit